MESFKPSFENNKSIGNKEGLNDKESKLKSLSKSILKRAALVGLLLSGSPDMDAHGQDFNGPESDSKRISRTEKPKDGLSLRGDIQDVTKQLHEEMMNRDEVITREKKQELFEKISSFSVSVVSHEGTLNKELSLEELDGEVLDINGFISLIDVEANSQLSIKVNDKDFRVVSPRQSSIKVNGENFRDQGSESNTFRAVSPYHSLRTPVSNESRLLVEFGIEDDQPLASFVIVQNVFEKVDMITLPYDSNEQVSGSIDTTHVYLINETKENLLSEIPDIGERFLTVAEGVKEAEEVFGVNLVDTLGVIGYEYATAFAVRDLNANNSTVYFSPQMLERSNQLIKVAARHESLHRLAGSALFAYAESLEDLWARTDKQVFKFLNESNFFALPEGDAGHSEDNFSELAASFLNSLMDVELINERLDEVNAENRSKIMNWYVEGINTLLGHLEERQDLFNSISVEGLALSDRLAHQEKLLKEHSEKHKEFFKSRLSYIKNIQKEL